MATQTAEKEKIVYKDLGFANIWPAIPKDYKLCQAEQHNHTQLQLNGTMHKIQCQTCHFEFTEDGEAPLLKRVVPPIADPTKVPPPPAVDQNMAASILTLLAKMTDRLDAMEKRLPPAPEVKEQKKP